MPYKSDQQRRLMWAKHPNAKWHEKMLGNKTKEQVKVALQTELRQYTQTYQGQRQPSAVIIKGDPEFIRGNHHADKFYNQLASYLRKMNYTVSFHKGAPSEDTKDVPPAADLWIGHSRGTNRLQYAPPGTQKLMFGSWRPGAINHPLDDQTIRGVPPNIFHYIVTKQMLSAIDRAHEKKSKNPKSS